MSAFEPSRKSLARAWAVIQLLSRTAGGRHRVDRQEARLGGPGRPGRGGADEEGRYAWIYSYARSAHRWRSRLGWRLDRSQPVAVSDLGRLPGGTASRHR